MNAFDPYAMPAGDFYDFIPDKDSTAIIVLKNGQPAYQIDNICGSLHCSCPAYHYNENFCKHIKMYEAKHEPV
jgi:hypothetical protein